MIHVAWLVLDAARVDHLSCYGYERPTSPTLGWLAKQSLVYENAYAASCWSLPSYASMFTGIFPSFHGVSSASPHLTEDFLTVAEVLRRNQYETAAVSSNAWVSKESGLLRGFEKVNEVWLSANRDAWQKARRLGTRLVKRIIGTEDSGANSINKWIVSWLDRRCKDIPFFLFALYSEPHIPYWPPRAYRRLYLGDAPGSVSHPCNGPSLWPKYALDPSILNDDDILHLIALYDAEITYVDRRLGELFRVMQLKRVWDDLLLIVTADHGEHFGEHGLVGHELSLYEPVIHVPLLIKLPRQAARGRINSLVHHCDLALSILKACGIESDGLQAQSLGVPLPGMIEQAQQRSVVFSEYLVPNIASMKRYCPDADVHQFDCSLQAVIDKRYKYIRASNGKRQLFDLRKDPKEKNNLFEANRSIGDRLEGILDSNLPCSQAITAFENYSPSEAVVNRLRALGYL